MAAGSQGQPSEVPVAPAAGEAGKHMVSPMSGDHEEEASTAGFPHVGKVHPDGMKLRVMQWLPRQLAFEAHCVLQPGDRNEGCVEGMGGIRSKAWSC